MGDEGAPFGRSFAGGQVQPAIVRTYDEEMAFIKRLTPWKLEIQKGFVPGMNVNGVVYANASLEELLFGELRDSCDAGSRGGFLPAVKQVANVAALPGIVGGSLGMPDIHSGYGK